LKQRQSIYFSQKKDKDLVDFLEPLVTHYDFNMIAKDLMRDGIKYRQGVSPLPVANPNVRESFKNVEESFKNVAQNLPTQHILEEKEEEEIEYDFEDKTLNEKDVLDLLNMDD
jgi:hypothetical protein